LGAKKDLKTRIIIGNHDCYYKNQIHPSTLELFNEYSHIDIIDDITQVDDILLVPWGQVPEEKYDAKYCFGHFAINGFHMNDSINVRGVSILLSLKILIWYYQGISIHHLNKKISCIWVLHMDRRFMM
jgi:hypothetical protein